MKHPERDKYRECSKRQLTLLDEMEKVENEFRSLYPRVLAEAIVSVESALAQYQKTPNLKKAQHLKLEAKCLMELVTDRWDKSRDVVMQLNALSLEFRKSFTKFHQEATGEVRLLLTHTLTSLTAIFCPLD